MLLLLFMRVRFPSGHASQPALAWRASIWYCHASCAAMTATPFCIENFLEF
jgi:hypothetical protein